MYTGAAQADVTTAAVNVIIMAHTTHFLKYMMINVSNIQSNSTSVHV